MKISSSSRPWWKEAVFYQIYPRSFKDSTGNGIGDLPGILEKLKYLVDLGIDAIWLSPVYPSPMADFGYDVTDHTNVDPLFGDLETLDLLIAKLHERGMRIILDYIPNHTSQDHPWFQESRASIENPKRDWYIWRDSAPDGGPPNNWMSHFGGPAWEFDPQTDQYYYHAFLKEQPDLNWRNPEVRAAMLDIPRFWLDRGVDGVRIDVIHVVFKDEQFRDNPLNTGQEIWREGDPFSEQIHQFDLNQPEIHELIRELRRLFDSYPGDRVTLGEVYLLNPAEVARYYGQDDELHLVFNFTPMNRPWEAEAMREAFETFDSSLPPGSTPTLVLGSHDEKRLTSRYGKGPARVAAMMLLTLRGTPFLYYGDEIGMLNGELTEADLVDPWPFLSGSPQLTRDPARTPMQWTPAPGAGFSPSDPTSRLPKPWLPIHPRYPEINVETLKEDPTSILNLYRDLLKLRTSTQALRSGSYQSLPSVPGSYFFRREQEGQRLLIALNFTSNPIEVRLQEDSQGQILLSTHLDREGAIELSRISLRGDEGLIIALSGRPEKLE